MRSIDLRCHTSPDAVHGDNFANRAGRAASGERVRLIQMYWSGLSGLRKATPNLHSGNAPNPGMVVRQSLLGEDTQGGVTQRVA